MYILLLEIKKILNWKTLLSMIFVNVILYYFLIDFEIKQFPNGRPALDSYRIGVEMVKDYGPGMNEAERADFKEKYLHEVSKADRLIRGREDFKAAGIHSYKDFQNINMDDEEKMKIHDKVFFNEGLNLFWELQERESLLDFHEHQTEILDNELSRADSSGKILINELKKSGQFSLYPEQSLMNFEAIIKNIAIAILISVVMVVSPIFLQDKIKHIRDLQYPSKIGRKLFKKKFAAGVISSLIVMTGLMAVYMKIYSSNNPSVFFDVPLNSFVGPLYWHHLTFFQYILLSIIAIYLLGLVIAAISMLVSNLAPSFIVLIGLQVIITLIVLIFGLKYMLGLILAMVLPIWLVPVCYILVIALTVISTAIMWTKEKKSDILI
ncbi:hypothetical protein [Falsibacillus pallidus]|uniref:ABC-2 family transporter n=1 Tax=Falsibacillus pallidus TaxID=493781 RepID=A0A370GCB2_9BACI|nr:hypothetical protein [Falsibacillus pallidus]RDI41351.1 hypothetical protein DFR59_1081 [Falsibacillus pallidus]